MKIRNFGIYINKLSYNLVILLTFICINFNCYAGSNIEITKGFYSPTPVAVNDFETENLSQHYLASKIKEVVEQDLKYSGEIHLINKHAFIENKKGVGHHPFFSVWRQINATFLLNASLEEVTGNKLKLSVNIFDTYLEQSIEDDVFIFSQGNYRKVAHKVADIMYQSVTGDLGYFNTKIAYISETGSEYDKIKRLAVMDQDGENHYYLTDGGQLVLTPRFSPNSKKLLYLGFRDEIPCLHLLNIHSGEHRILGDFPGMSFAPRFSSDGNRAIFSIANRGATNIFELDLPSNEMTKLTSSTSSINTSPSYSPDGGQIVFNSDRGGSRQIYTMNSDGRKVKRISFGGGSYTAPVWSPRGDYIAFVKSVPGENFYIGVMHPDGSGERLIANGYLLESPSWSPSGRIILFTKASKPDKVGKVTSKLYSIDITGYNERHIKTPKDASDPNWSDILQ